MIPPALIAATTPRTANRSGDSPGRKHSRHRAKRRRRRGGLARSAILSLHPQQRRSSQTDRGDKPRSVSVVIVWWTWAVAPAFRHLHPTTKTTHLNILNWKHTCTGDCVCVGGIFCNFRATTDLLHDGKILIKLSIHSQMRLNLDART